MTEIRLRNTLTRQRDVLVPARRGRVGLYVCGPTVYDHAHLGHARVYVFFDTLVRFLESRGLEVTYVRNVTDIDDKILKRAAETGEPWQEVAERFTRSFHADMEALNVRRPTHEPRATEHIDEMVGLIEKLVAKGLAYDLDGDVYFSVQRFPGYGRLSGRSLDRLKAGARVEVDSRLDHPADFALWKRARPGEPSWPSPWGPGRPGWHIECSAMSERYLGTDFDIHGGGMDLIFPHHENEIAQSEGAHETPLCRMFVHNGFVNVNKEKMSKSRGNFFLVRQVLEHGHPEAVRLFLLGTHYHAPIDLLVDIDEHGDVVGFPQIAEARKRIRYYYETKERLEEMAGGGTVEPPPAAVEMCDDLRRSITGALADDVNTARAVGRLNEFFRTVNEAMSRGGSIGKKQRRGAARAFLDAISETTSTLGLLASSPAEYFARETSRALRALPVTAEQVEEKLDERRRARAARDWPRADAIRDELLALGIEIRDAGETTSWRVR
jgi:cysteinyl-tRNA synthetase